MKKTFITGLFISTLALAGCAGGGSTPEKPHYYLTIDVEKSNCDYIFAESYLIEDHTTSITRYHPSLITKIDGDTKYKIDITGKKEFDLIITCNSGYDLKDTSFNYDGNTIDEITKVKLGTKYHIFEVKNLAQKNVDIAFTYSVTDAQYKVTIGKFVAPTTDPNNVYSSLKFKAWVNGEAVKYQDSEDILASNLETALKALGTDGVITVGTKNGIKLVGKIDKDDYFFNDILNVYSLASAESMTVDSQADYIDLTSEYSLTPCKDCNFYLDYSNLDTKNYKDYTIKSYFGRDMKTTITHSAIYLDGNVYTEPLTNKVINDAQTVKIVYNKDQFAGVEDLTKYNGAISEISSIRYSSGNERGSRITADADNLTVIIKDSTATPAKDGILWYSGWLDGSSDKRHNMIVKNNQTVLDIVIFKVSA